MIFIVVPLRRCVSFLRGTVVPLRRYVSFCGRPLYPYTDVFLFAGDRCTPTPIRTSPALGYCPRTKTIIIGRGGKCLSHGGPFLTKASRFHKFSTPRTYEYTYRADTFKAAPSEAASFSFNLSPFMLGGGYFKWF